MRNAQLELARNDMLDQGLDLGVLLERRGRLPLLCNDLCKRVNDRDINTRIHCSKERTDSSSSSNNQMHTSRWILRNGWLHALYCKPVQL